MSTAPATVKLQLEVALHTLSMYGVISQAEHNELTKKLDDLNNDFVTKRTQMLDSITRQLNREQGYPTLASEKAPSQRSDASTAGT
jgi:hypothetical protein